MADARECTTGKANLFTMTMNQRQLDQPAISPILKMNTDTIPSAPATVSHAIQAAECSHNTRTSTTQTFAVFETDHQYDSSHGAPYGTCSAYTCKAPNTPRQMKDCTDFHTFFWVPNHGKQEGPGTGCIEDPNTGECGCETSDGVFHVGRTNCT